VGKTSFASHLKRDIAAAARAEKLRFATWEPTWSDGRALTGRERERAIKVAGLTRYPGETVPHWWERARVAIERGAAA
jgi:hypothetical protein